MAIMHRVDVVTTGLAGAPFYTRFYGLASAGTAAQASVAVGNFLTGIAPQISSNFTSTVQGAVTEVESTTDAVVGVFPVTPIVVVGTSNGSPNPAATQGLLRIRTGTYLGGREIRGRVFIWGTVQTQNLNAAPFPAYRTAIDNSATTLAGLTNFDWLVYSRLAKVYAAVNGVSTWEKWAVLRSRRD